MSGKQILEHARAFIPSFTASAHKGQAGKIAVIGGCREYTGAPYYSAISALKVGVDLSHIFCAEGAGTPIKSYSPEIIVHPTLKEEADEKPSAEAKEKIVKGVTSWFQAIHACVIGPGLGRDNLLRETTAEILKQARQKELPLIIDGDGINLVCTNPDLVRGYRLAVLTPNVVEYKRLCEAVFPNYDKDKDYAVKDLAKELGNVTIVQKGKADVISDGQANLECAQIGGPRRCGGQGDMLTGCIVTFVTWAVDYVKDGEGKGKSFETPPVAAACFAACSVSRHASCLAFKKHRRATTTPDMIQELGSAFEELFPGSSEAKL